MSQTYVFKKVWLKWSVGGGGGGEVGLFFFFTPWGEVVLRAGLAEFQVH